MWPKRLHRILLLLSGCLVLLQLASRPCRAQEPVPLQPGACPCPEILRHVLAGHAFLPSFAVPTPFASSQATFSLGFGYEELTTRVLLQDRELKLGGLQPQIHGQVRIVSGLALSLGVRGNVVVGLDSTSVLDYGASASYAFQLGAIFEVLRVSSSVLSVALDVSRPNTFSVSPLDAAEAGIQSLVGVGDANFITQRTRTRWAPNLRFAHAFGSFLGVQSILGLRLDDTTVNDDESSLNSTLHLGLGLSSDFKNWIRVPIGLSVNYRRGQAISSGTSNSDALTFGAFETISGNFNMGFELGFVSGSSRSATTGALIAKAYYD